MNFRHNILVSALTFICTLSAQAAQNRTIKIATLEWPPYSSEKLKEGGYSMAIIKRIFEEAGYKVEMKYMPWARVLSEVEKGSLDVAACAYPSEERKQKYFMSNPFVKAPLGFFKLKDKTINYQKIEDLKPYKIGTVRGYVNSEEFDKADYIKKEAVDKDEQNYTKLIAGRIDLAVGDRANGFAIINKLIQDEKDPKKKEQLKNIEFVNPPLVDYTLHVLGSRAVKDGETIVKDFNKALEKLEKSGEIKNIEKAYGLDFT